MKRFTILTAVVYVVLSVTPARGQEASTPTVAPATIGATVTPGGTAIPSTPFPTSTVVLPTPVRTPNPDTPTPVLPEEGGPAGGVIGGALYIDGDGSGALKAGDPGIDGSVVELEYLSTSDTVFGFTHATRSAVSTGRWDFRGLPEGAYRVTWEPPLRDPADGARTIPPVEEVQEGAGQVLRITETVNVLNASRTLDVNFGLPVQRPIFAPSTGRGSATQSSASIAFLLLLVAVPAVVIALGLARRRGRT